MYKKYILNILLTAALLIKLKNFNIFYWMSQPKIYTSDKKHAILHVLVVGFHHKRGYQIEYCYPSIVESSKTFDLEKNFPLQWRELPSLAIPDGAHNVESGFFLISIKNYFNYFRHNLFCFTFAWRT